MLPTIALGVGGERGRWGAEEEDDGQRGHFMCCASQNCLRRYEGIDENPQWLLTDLPDVEWGVCQSERTGKKRL